MIRNRTALLVVAAAFLVGCQDSRLPTDADPGQLSPLISDGAHTDPGTGLTGNSHFFFLPPMVPSPDIPETETFNPALTPRVFICEFEAAANPVLDRTKNTEFCSGGGTVAGVSDRAIGPFDAPRVEGKEHYIFHWQTVNDGLLVAENPDGSGAEVFYRVFVVAAGEEVGFADVDVEGTQAQLDLVDEDLFVPLFIDRTLPVKFFIGVGFVCEARGLTDCGDGFSDFDNGEDDVITFNNSGVSIPDQPQTQEFQVGAITVIVTPCSDPDNLPIDLPRFGTCFDIETFPPLDAPLPVEATVFNCLDPGLVAVDAQLTDDSQLDLLTVHRWDKDGTDDIQALPHAAAPCETIVIVTSTGGSGLLRYARAGWNAVTGMAALLLAPEPLYAKRRRRGNLGPGGSAGSFSRFQIALPSKIDVFAGDAQVAPAGTVLGTDPTVIVTDANGAAVRGATVRFTSPAPDLLPNPTPDGSVSSPKVVVTGADGKASVSWTLASTPGANELDAFGRGLAGPADIPRPFAPPVPDDGSPAVTVETGVLTFSAIGCEPGDGVGTSDVNGVIDTDEWVCAKQATFPVNLSGGSTVDAMLFWMNDADNFHLAVVVPGTGRQNGLRIDWDNNGDGILGGANEGAREAGDDVWEFDPDGGPADKYINEKCSESSQSGCGKDDDAFGGGMDTRVAFNNTLGGTTVYEMSHPLSTGDLCTIDGRKGCGVLLDRGIDLDASAGNIKGFFLTLRLGSGAQGNTQWPGFLQYLRIEIK